MNSEGVQLNQEELDAKHYISKTDSEHLQEMVFSSYQRGPLTQGDVDSQLLDQDKDYRQKVTGLLKHLHHDYDLVSSTKVVHHYQTGVRHRVESI